MTPELERGAEIPTTRRSADGQQPNPLKRLKRLALRSLHRLGRTRSGRRALQELLKDDETLAYVFQHLSNQLSARASFPQAAPPRKEILGFEDCVWLYSSNQLNHGLSRLSISEAAYLFALVRSLPAPAVVEIGRFRGGSTFLLAIAGAGVLSIDLDSERQRADDEALGSALARFGLRDRVELELASSQTYAYGDRRFDVVFVDGDHRYEGVRADFEHWWPTVAPGGSMVLHDAVPGTPGSDGVVPLVREIRQRDDAVEVPNAPDSLVHFVKQPRNEAGSDLGPR